MCLKRKVPSRVLVLTAGGGEEKEEGEKEVKRRETKERKEGNNCLLVHGLNLQ